MKRLFVICNEGMHPIRPLLEKQYNFNKETDEYLVVTEGNVELSRDALKKTIVELREKLLDVVGKRGYPDEVYFVNSGLPLYAFAIYIFVTQFFSKHPVFLQFDRESSQYLEFKLDPREILFGEGGE